MCWRLSTGARAIETSIFWTTTVHKTCSLVPVPSWSDVIIISAVSTIWSSRWCHARPRLIRCYSTMCMPFFFPHGTVSERIGSTRAESYSRVVLSANFLARQVHRAVFTLLAAGSKREGEGDGGCLSSAVCRS